MAKDWILQITRQSLALSVLLIASLPAFGQYESAEEFYIPKGCEIVTLTTPISTDIQWADGYYFFASGKGIFACDHQKNLTLLIEAKSDINAFCLGENVLFFHTGSSLARYSFESKTTETISRKIKGKVTMASLGGALYFSFNQDIFLYEDGEMYGSPAIFRVPLPKDPAQPEHEERQIGHPSQLSPEAFHLGVE